MHSVQIVVSLVHSVEIAGIPLYTASIYIYVENLLYGCVQLFRLVNCIHIVTSWFAGLFEALLTCHLVYSLTFGNLYDDRVPSVLLSLGIFFPSWFFL